MATLILLQSQGGLSSGLPSALSSQAVTIRSTCKRSGYEVVRGSFKPIVGNFGHVASSTEQPLNVEIGFYHLSHTGFAEDYLCFYTLYALKTVRAVVFGDIFKMTAACQYHTGTPELRLLLDTFKRDVHAGFTIFLSRLWYSKAVEIANTVPGIDVLISTSPLNRNLTPLQCAGTLVIPSERMDSSISRLELTLADGQFTDYRYAEIATQVPDGKSSPRATDDMLSFAARISALNPCPPSLFSTARSDTQHKPNPLRRLDRYI